jgi:peptidoglycan hydrolase-like protein with peptidoglycan-binding domain
MKRTAFFIAIASGLAISTAYAQPSQGQNGQNSHQKSAQQESGQQTHSADMVKQVQQKLSAKGHKLSADGKMGPKTEAALKDYQQQNGLQATGQIDQETLAKLGIESRSAATGGSNSRSPNSGASGHGGASGASTRK